MKSNIVILSVFITILCGCAMQQDVVTLDDRITMIEKRNTKLEERFLDLGKNSADLQSKIDKYSLDQNQKGQTLRDQHAGINVTIDRLREEIQDLNGRLEENDYILKKKINYYEVIDKQQEDRLKNLEESLRLIQDGILSLEQYLNLEPSANRFKKDTDSIVKSENQSEEKFSENEIYILAKKAFDQADFEEARLKFQKLIQKYPQSKNADNAQFWIGETYYREKWYEKAILEYQNVIEKYPKGNKVQASLLKQGFSFFNLGDKANARLILKELIGKYPKSNEAKIAKQKLKGSK